MTETNLPEEPKWYCLRSQPKHEHIAAAHLRQIEGVAVYCPRVRMQKSTRRGLAWFVEALFPNYLFAHFSLRALLRRVRSSHGVVGIVKFGERYPAIDAAAIEELRAAMHDEEIFSVAAPLGEGDEVRIVEGPLRGASGTITRILPARERVKVLLEFLGGEKEIELKLSAVFRAASPPLQISDAHTARPHGSSVFSKR